MDDMQNSQNEIPNSRLTGENQATNNHHGAGKDQEVGKGKEIAQSLQTGTTPTSSEVQPSIKTQEVGTVPATNPKLIDKVRRKLRMLHYAKRTEEAYVGWILDVVQFARDQAGQWVHPELLKDQDIEAYLTYLAMDRRVAAITQNQALSIDPHVCKPTRSRRVDLVHGQAASVCV